MPAAYRPLDCCAGPWPAGPFRIPPGANLPAEAADAAAAAGRLAAVLTRRRAARGWSRARLSRTSGVDQHTVGRIENGTVWPDLATIERLANAMNLELALVRKGSSPTDGRPAGTQTPVPETPPQAAAETGAAPAPEPLALDLPDEASAAHVIEAILHASPRVASHVETLRRQRALG